MQKEKLSLSVPVEFGNQTISELELRLPTTAEIRKIGRLPYIFGKDGQPIPDLDICAKFISTCAQIPPSVVDKLSIGDFQEAAWVVTRFFTQPLFDRYANLRTEPSK